MSPCYCEAGNIEQFHKVLSETIRQETDYEWKVLFIDDGSHDNTLEEMRKIVDLDNRTLAVALARNFGKEAALMAGVKEALPCDAVICMDADLQHPPGMIPQLLKEWRMASRCCNCPKKCESHSMVRKIGSSTYYKIMKSLGGNLLIPKSTDFRLVDRFVIDHLQLKENVRMFRGMIDWFGFPTAIVYFNALSVSMELQITAMANCSSWPLPQLHLFSLATEAYRLRRPTDRGFSSLSSAFNQSGKESGLSVP